MFWKRKTPSSDTAEDAPAKTTRALEVRPAIEECLHGCYGGFFGLEIVASMQTETGEETGMTVFTRFHLPGGDGNQGIAVFLFDADNPAVRQFSTVSSGPLPGEAEAEADEEVAQPIEEPVRTVLGMRVAAETESNGR